MAFGNAGTSLFTDSFSPELKICNFAYFACFEIVKKITQKMIIFVYLVVLFVFLKFLEKW